MRHHFHRDSIEKRLIEIVPCETDEQIVEIVTKAMEREYFEKNRLALGLINQL